MKVKIEPSKARGKIKAPPSKSMAHRMLICAGLSKEKSIVRGIAPSEDMMATMDCMKALGAHISYDGDSAEIEGIDINKINSALLNCRECGSTLRFFVPIALLFGKKVTFTGSERLFSRPMSVYEKICEEQKIYYSIKENTLEVCGKLRAGEYTVLGNISSQFISGLLFVLPILEGDSKINILPPVESRPYIDMTLQALALFGVQAYFTDDRTIFVKGAQSYIGKDVEVEGDYSNAAFFDALNFVGGDVDVEGLSEDSLQGDRVYKKYFNDLKKGTAKIDLSDCPDLGPVCMALSAALYGAEFIGTKRLLIKESDRCAAMATELAKFGIKSEVRDNSMTVFKSDLKAPTEIVFGHNDHRIVMALSVLLTLTGGEIEGAQAVKKSLPDFFERIKSLGVNVIKEKE